MLCLFLVECELILAGHYAERTAMRAWLHLPLYHLFLGLLTYSILLFSLQREELARIPTRFSLIWLVLHLSYAVALNFLLTPLWGKVPFGFWLCALAGFCATWLAILIQPRRWGGLLAYLPQTLLAGLLSVLTLAIADASYSLWRVLAKATLTCTSIWLSLLFPDPVVYPEKLLVGTTNFQVEIQAGCSGLEGMGLTAVYTIVYLTLRRKWLCFPRAFLLLPFGMLTIWLVNTLRLAALVTVGECLSPALARQGFHTQSGWIGFTLLAIGLLILADRSPWFQRQPTTEAEVFPALPYLMPLVVTLLAQMVLGAFSGAFDSFYPLRALAVAVALWHFRRAYPIVLRLPRLSSLLAGVGVYCLWVALVPARSAPELDPLVHGWPTPELWILSRLAGAVLLAPLVEELAFRGYLLRRLQAREFRSVPLGRLTVMSCLGSSVAFGLLHSHILAATLAGVVYALVVWRTRGLLDAMFAHAVTNACLAVHIFIFQAWSLWG